MSRAARLLALMQALRRRRAPVTAEALAGELGVSARTLYRDIATLRGEGAPIAGEAGLGSVLEEGFFLPPADLDFGRTFTAADPDGHRLRVFRPSAG